MALWRCKNAACSSPEACRPQFDFEGAAPVCPRCGVDGREMPDVIDRRTLLHFDPPHPVVRGRGAGHAACDRGKRVMGSAHVGFTGDAAQVSCAACRRAPAWIEAAKDRDIVPETDFVVSLVGDVVTRG